MNEIWEKLKAPFPPVNVSWRVGATNGEKTKGLALAYIDARDVMERLDAVVGPENWQNKYSHANGKTVCDIGVRIEGEWVWKADGAGDTDTEAEKGALSDAFKRAAVRFGIGRYLYDLGNTWAEIEAFGRSYRIKESEYAKLRSRLPAPGPINSDGTAAQPLKRDEARVLFKTLQGLLVTCNTDREVMQFEHDNDAQIALLGDWRIHFDKAIAQHRAAIADAQGKAA